MLKYSGPIIFASFLLGILWGWHFTGEIKHLDKAPIEDTYTP